MPRNISLDAGAPPASGAGWNDGMPTSNAQAARQRAAASAALLGETNSQAIAHRAAQPLGGRPAAAVAAAASGGNPFESRLFSSGTAARPHAQHTRMQGQHGPAMASMDAFAGAAGVASSRASGATVNQGSRQVRQHTLNSNAAGGTTYTISKDEYIFHDGPHALRMVPDEGTVRSKRLVGAAATVGLVGIGA